MEPEYIVEPLGKQHDRAAFSCGVEPLDRYLKQQASQDVRASVASVFVALPSVGASVIGYYTLSANTVALSDIPEDLRKRLPRYPNLPAVLLGRLAVDTNHAGKGLGGALLLHALERSLRVRDQVAFLGVLVDAKDDRARRFYERFHFQQLARQSDRLFLPVQTIEKMLKTQ